MQTTNLSLSKQLLLIITSLLCVAFAQPAWVPALGLLAAAFGYALFFRVLLCCPKLYQRFLVGTVWFTSVQLVQLSWMISHPFLYIIAPYFLFSLFMGCQFGIIALLITPTALLQIPSLLGVAGLWTLMEWGRIFFLSGFSWNQAGMALAANTYSLQFASVIGSFGLSFWIIFVNLLLLRAWLQLRLTSTALWLVLALFPYLFGYVHLQYQQEKLENTDLAFTALLVQPSFPVEAEIPLEDRKEMVGFVTGQWKKMLELIVSHRGKSIDLIALPEYVVPFGTYTPVFPYNDVKTVFRDVFGEASLVHLAPLEEHLAINKITRKCSVWLVSNAFWLQSIANVFNAPVIAGLADVDEKDENEWDYYSSAQYFTPSYTENEERASAIPIRYNKRVLVPLGEYIPFSFCRQLAAAYGIQGSFMCGKEAKVCDHSKAPFGVSICYEETFGNIIRENKKLGAKLLVNLTSDAWFPRSRLAEQHLNQAQMRCVEGGLPAVRSCNTGVTAGIDSFGRVISSLAESDENQEPIKDSLLVKVPIYNYDTIYSKHGDAPVISFSIIAILIGLQGFRKKEYNVENEKVKEQADMTKKRNRI